MQKVDDEMIENKKKEIGKRLFLHPVVIVLYALMGYFLSDLCQYGRKYRNLPALAGCLFLFLVWEVWNIYLGIRNKGKLTFGRYYTVGAIVVMLGIAAFYGTKIFKSAQPFNGKLYWFLYEMENKRMVALEHGNIFEYGVDGIFTDLETEISLPETLSIATTFSLKFSADGTITFFDTFLYGRNQNGELESFLISYDCKKSSKMTVYLNGTVTEEDSEKKRLEPFLDTMRLIPLKESISKWKQDSFGILYSGERSFGYNIEGICYLDMDGTVTEPIQATTEIIGNFVSVYVPGLEEMYTPLRFALMKESKSLEGEEGYLLRFTN